MRYAAVLPWASEREFVELAGVAEDAGWDMVLTWEAVWAQDAWATLAAAAVATERIRLGTLLTPVSRYRPWDLASRVGSVDRLSGGRVTLGVGLGALHENWLAFEPDEGRAVRAAKVDEGLAVYAGLLGGQPFEFAGEHWSARPVEMLAPPPPVQRPHPPVWCVGALVPGARRQRSLERAARWQGVLPAVAGGTVESPGSRLTPATLRAVVEHVAGLRAEAGLTMAGYDVVVEGDSHGGFADVRPPTEPWRQAGATWWVESWWDLPDSDEGRAELRRRLELGPVR
ncbi:LLM class flavin-dependent oxidoreductase [Phycicoccus endophyticus]|uniref:LLM class flavin-dependent oxidoreductase n=1 Tax=Phycicoccus endophyticus TaxID=1690220 RepID=A0A7G9QYL6_9MICO|nr:LLM class flavin-dependent oxidoreductase [Phycicoccus endophyticus]NHI19345.1 LLM class flavin-dependent oxidoreductase [Phycicoccus endophyticus]QNN48441.1 LLM class flavin-dependent oxidoreductase [Phycicoccus endophyticus]GGL42000.1 luciferase-like protein [Phycicoccus endophyticus]